MPKPIRQATYGVSQLKNPVGAAAYHGIERPVTTVLRGGGRRTKKAAAPVYRHDGCAVKHRSPEAAERCRNGSSAKAPTKAQLRDRAIADASWLLQHPAFNPLYWQESIPELEPLLEDGEYEEAAELVVSLWLMSAGNSKANAAEIAGTLADARRHFHVTE